MQAFSARSVLGACFLPLAGMFISHPYHVPWCMPLLFVLQEPDITYVSWPTVSDAFKSALKTALLDYTSFLLPLAKEVFGSNTGKAGDAGKHFGCHVTFVLFVRSLQTWQYGLVCLYRDIRPFKPKAWTKNLT